MREVGETARLSLPFPFALRRAALSSPITLARLPTTGTTSQPFRFGNALSKAGIEPRFRTFRAWVRKFLSGCKALASATASDDLPPPKGPVQVKQRWFVSVTCLAMFSKMDVAVE